jgi:hypothetical protein
MYVMLNLGVHVHLLKEDELIPACAIDLHGFVLLDGVCQAGNEERRERQELSRGRFVLASGVRAPWSHRLRSNYES